MNERDEMKARISAKILSGEIGPRPGHTDLMVPPESVPDLAPADAVERLDKQVAEVERWLADGGALPEALRG